VDAITYLMETLDSKTDALPYRTERLAKAGTPPRFSALWSSGKRKLFW